MAWVNSLHVGSFEVTIDTTKVAAVVHGGPGFTHGMVVMEGQDPTTATWVMDESYAVVKAALAV